MSYPRDHYLPVRKGLVDSYALSFYDLPMRRCDCLVIRFQSGSDLLLTKGLCYAKE
jgi:hypothetical protein